MGMTLSRSNFLSCGIFGTLKSDDGGFNCCTLEHAFQDAGAWLPKLPTGTYQCVRGVHQLLHGAPFETFEITGVPGHTGILLHQGNVNDDSNGCVLVGKSIEHLNNGVDIITRSRITFEAMMLHLTAVDQFTLTVI